MTLPRRIGTASTKILALGAGTLICYAGFWIISITRTTSVNTLLVDPTVQFQAVAATGLLVCALIALRILHNKHKQMTQLHTLAKSIVNLRDPEVRISSEQFNELGPVAGVINQLMDQLNDSIETRRSLAELDALILSGADLSAITRRCLIAAQIDAVDTLLILKSEDNESDQYLHELDGLKVSKTFINNLNPSSGTMLDLRFLTDVVRQRKGNVLANHVILCEEEPYGVLFASGNRPLSGTETKRLEDLVDRMSVAITNVKRSETLYNQANFDPLTGLLNRRAFESRLAECLHRSKRDESGVVLFLDLDGFKKVNDSAGHEAGDFLLALVAEKLRQVIRPEDTIARIGGDEFAVIASDCSEEKEISNLCERIIKTLTEPVAIEHIEHTIGTSIGIARYPDDGSEVDEILTKADSAMYKAKQEGGSRFAFFDDNLKAINDHRVLMESRLRTAIKEGGLGLFFQPKLGLTDWTINSAEALLRWRDERLGVVSSQEFVNVAEESGMMQDIMPIIIQKTSELLRRSDAEPVPLECIAINASPKQIMTEGFALSILSHLDALQVPHERIEIEVTETVFAPDMQQVLTELHILRMAGIKVALDDFGTGYSSLNMLRDLPLDIVKIDRTFITELEDSKEARSVLKHLIEIAAVLKLEVVAEGVETDLQLQELIENGCDYVQGWFISKALPTSDFLEFVRSWNNQSAQIQQSRGLQRRSLRI